MDVSQLSNEILSALRERGLSDQQVAILTPREVFDEYCSWHGLINWGDRLWGIVNELKAVEPMPAVSSTPVKQDFSEDDLGFLQTADTKVLSAVARGELNLNMKAVDTLVDRGMDVNGNWVGFDAAKSNRAYSSAELASLQGFDFGKPNLIFQSAPCAGHSIPLQKSVQEVPRVVIWIEGGMVQGAVAGSPVDIAVIDYDIEGADDDDLMDIDQGNGKTAQAVCHIENAEINSARADQLFFAVEEVKDELSVSMRP